MLTTRRALELLEQAVKEKGHDYVYPKAQRLAAGGPTCVYIHDNCPDCIVGHVLVNSGLFTIEELDRTFCTVEGVYYRFPGRMTERARNVLQVAQEVQDAGRPWGEVLDAALRASGLV